MVFLWEARFLQRYEPFSSQSWFITQVFLLLISNLIMWLQLKKCRKLIHIAQRTLKGESDYYYGIEACNEVLAFPGLEIEPTIMLECLCIRASLLLKVLILYVSFNSHLGLYKSCVFHSIDHICPCCSGDGKMMCTWLSGTAIKLGKSILLQLGH